MGIREVLQKAAEDRRKKRAESKAFQKVVDKRALQVRRQAYEKEAIEQAKLKGKAIAQHQANKKTIGQRAASGAQRFAERLTRPPVKRRLTTVRRRPIKRRLKTTSKRVTPKRRRLTSSRRKVTRTPREENQIIVGDLF